MAQEKNLEPTLNVAESLITLAFIQKYAENGNESVASFTLITLKPEGRLQILSRKCFQCQC